MNNVAFFRLNSTSALMASTRSSHMQLVDVQKIVLANNVVSGQQQPIVEMGPIGSIIPLEVIIFSYFLFYTSRKSTKVKLSLGSL